MSDITQPPEDETAELGKDITLQCMSNNTEDTILWRCDQYDNGNSPIYRTGRDIADPSKYELENDTGTNHNLIIKNTVWNDGGEYLCRIVGGIQFTSQLVVLGR